MSIFIQMWQNRKCPEMILPPCQGASCKWWADGRPPAVPGAPGLLQSPSAPASPAPAAAPLPGFLPWEGGQLPDSDRLRVQASSGYSGYAGEWGRMLVLAELFNLDDSVWTGSHVESATTTLDNILIKLIISNWHISEYSAPQGFGRVKIWISQFSHFLIWYEDKSTRGCNKCCTKDWRPGNVC